MCIFMMIFQVQHMIIISNVFDVQNTKQVLITVYIG